MYDPEHRRLVASFPRGGTLLADRAREHSNVAAGGPESKWFSLSHAYGSQNLSQRLNQLQQHALRPCGPGFQLPGVSTLLSRCSTNHSQSRGATSISYRLGEKRPNDPHFSQYSSNEHIGATRAGGGENMWASKLTDSRPYPCVRSSNASRNNIRASESRRTLREDHGLSHLNPLTADSYTATKRATQQNEQAVMLPPLELQRQPPSQVHSSQYYSLHNGCEPGPKLPIEASTGRKRKPSSQASSSPNDCNQSIGSRVRAPSSNSSDVANSKQKSESATQESKFQPAPSPIPVKKSSRYLREMDRRVILSRIAHGEKQSALAKEFHVSRAAICNLNKHRDEVLSRQGENPFAKHPKKPRLAKHQHAVTTTSSSRSSLQNTPVSTSCAARVLYKKLTSFSDPQSYPSSKP